MSTSRLSVGCFNSAKSNVSMMEPMNFNLDQTKRCFNCAESDRSMGKLEDFNLDQTKRCFNCAESDRSMGKLEDFNLDQTKSPQVKSGQRKSRSDSSVIEDFNGPMVDWESRESGLNEKYSSMGDDGCSNSLWNALEEMNKSVEGSSKSFMQRLGCDETGFGILSAKKHLKLFMRQKYAKTLGVMSDPEEVNFYTDVVTGEAEDMLSTNKCPLEKKLSNRFLPSLENALKPGPGQEKPIRTIVTEGVAGIGKTTSVQKCILNWAEDKTNRDVDFILTFAFRELNLVKGQKSLDQLVTDFCPALHGLIEPEDLNRAKVIVILDGLDENKLLLDFHSPNIASVSEVTTLNNLLVNLIKGSLLPDAQLWITTRPMASLQIPAKYVDMVMGIRGFGVPQKEEYFRRRFSSDPDTADAIISHMRSSAAFSTMCQIPLFSSISALLFEENSVACSDDSLTEMMVHFLLAQLKLRCRKYGEGRNKKSLEKNKDFLSGLCKLAFVQLQKKKHSFDESDLDKCGVDFTEAMMYSGFCNRILRGKDVPCKTEVFVFVNVTIQEFFAAMYIQDCFLNKDTAELEDILHEPEYTLPDVPKEAFEKVLKGNLRILEGLMRYPKQSREIMQMHLKTIQGNFSPANRITRSQSMVGMGDLGGTEKYLQRSHTKTEDEGYNPQKHFRFPP